MPLLIGLFITLFITAIVEQILSATWNRTYFEKGIRVYRKEILLNKATEIEHLFNNLIRYSKSERKIENITFNVLGNDCIPFREKMLSLDFLCFRYTPLMHGNIKFIPKENKLEIYGVLYWFLPLFLACWYLFIALFFLNSNAIEYRVLIFALFSFSPIVALLIIYLIQKRKYDIIVEYLESN